MDQSTDDIRQDIDTIRDSMTDKLEAIETKIKGTVDETTTNIKQTFDFKHQVSQRPWIAFGAAIAVGYMLGGRDDRPSYYDMPRYNGNNASNGHAPAASSNGAGFLDQIGDSVGGELQMIKGMAASALVALITDTIKRNVPIFKDAIDRARTSGVTGTTTATPRYSPASTYTTPSSQSTYSESPYTPAS